MGMSNDSAEQVHEPPVTLGNLHQPVDPNARGRLVDAYAIADALRIDPRVASRLLTAFRDASLVQPQRTVPIVPGGGARVYFADDVADALLAASAAVRSGRPLGGLSTTG